jgi:hypothetical protein
MNDKEIGKWLDEIKQKDIFGKTRIYEKIDNNDYEWGDWYEKKEVPEIPISIEGVLRKFKPEELVEAIGIEKVESIIRAHKIKLLKKKIKK